MKQPRNSLGSHNRRWIWGRHVVLETLRAGVWTPSQVIVSTRCATETLREVERFCGHQSILLEVIDDAALAKRCRADDHQGLAAEMPAFPYATLDELLHRRPALRHWLVLDRLQDSFNFGAIVRSAHALGMGAVLIGEQEQSDVNSQVVRSSAGAVNYLPIARVPSLLDAIVTLRRTGVRLVAATEKAAQTIGEWQWDGPVALVIGNEGRGIQPEILAQCDDQVRIPMHGRVGSLNAAVAAGILCYELTKRNQPRP